MLRRLTSRARTAPLAADGTREQTGTYVIWFIVRSFPEVSPWVCACVHTIAGKQQALTGHGDNL